MSTFLINTLKVTSFSTWKQIFDNANANRIAKGIHIKAIYTAIDDENLITVISEVPSAVEAQGIIENITAQATKKELVLDFVNYKIVQDIEFNISDESNKITILLSHDVEDIQHWKTIFDLGELNRKNAQIDVKAIFTDTEKYVLVLSETDNQENFIKLSTNPELKLTMEKAGVIGKPNVQFLVRK